MQILSVRIDAEVKARLEELAVSTARTKSWLAAEAVRQFVENNEWQIQAVEEGVRASATDGMISSHETVMETWTKRLDAGLLPHEYELPPLSGTVGAAPEHAVGDEERIAPWTSIEGDASTDSQPTASRRVKAIHGVTEEEAEAPRGADRLRSALSSFVRRGA
ncbi:MAG: ribbon-helix-helix domain-containing protein [Alphaproteobacteria bacterium]|nr:ribbon-helix-helix domain-containing protein [Alphaproteobacteria bacterium]